MQTRTLRTVLVSSLLAVGLAGCAAFSSSDTRSTSSPEPRSATQTASDAAITGKVKAALALDELVKARNINVDTMRGVVTLNGTVNSAAEKARAMQVSRRIEGVTDVRDNLKAP